MADAAEGILSGDRTLIVLDVEATCWKNVWNRRKETIEIGAVRYLAGKSAEDWPTFQTFARPTLIPRISNFCRELTGITQADVAAAPTFPGALERFLSWCAPIDRVVLASWSTYDLWQLELDLELHHLPKLRFPHLDVKKLSTRILGGKSFEATAAALGVPFEEGRHRALADAKKTAEILDRLL
jgi:inhibitor of KinA sporulation pathway (predicted exonuclease)